MLLGDFDLDNIKTWKVATQLPLRYRGSLHSSEMGHRRWRTCATTALAEGVGGKVAGRLGNAARRNLSLCGELAQCGQRSPVFCGRKWEKEAVA